MPRPYTNVRREGRAFVLYRRLIVRMPEDLSARQAEKLEEYCLKQAERAVAEMNRRVEAVAEKNGIELEVELWTG